LPVSSGQVKDGTFTIPSVTADDVGWYQCYVTIRNDTYSSIGYFLNVIPKGAEVGNPRVNSTSELDSITHSEHSVQRVGNSVIYEEGVAQNCSCCPMVATPDGNHKRRHHGYAVPKIRVMNRTTDVLRHKSSIITIRMEVCSNPKSHRLLWVTPDSYAVTTGQTVGAYRASRVILSDTKATCEQAHLDIDTLGSGLVSESQEGEYTLIAKNHHGMSEAHTVVKNPTSADSDEKTKSYAQKRNTVTAAAAAASKAINVTTPTATTALYCLLLVIKFMYVGREL